MSGSLARGRGVLAKLSRGWWATVFALAIVLAAIAAVALWWTRDPGRTVIAHFTRTVGIYPDSDVRIMGVKVGTVVDVVPEGPTVRVVMRYDSQYRVPADVKAIIVPPSLVSDRYVQLAPAYTGGPTLRDGAELPVERTVAPLEVDEIYAALDELAQTLGPEGVNSTGALSRLLAAGRENLEGNGEQLGQTLDDLASAIETLSEGRHDLFGTIENLQEFTTVLAESDQEIRNFNEQLAEVSEQLAAEREELAAALHNLGIALQQISTFVKENREALVENIDGLTDVTGALVKQQEALIEIVETAPAGVGNLALAYNHKSGTTDTRMNLMGPYDAASWICSLTVHVLPAEQIPQDCFRLAQILHEAGAALTPELGKLLGLKIPLPSNDTGEAPPVGGPSGEASMDPTLGGILGGS